MGDLLVVPLEGAAGWTLTTEIERAQQMPDMPGMIAHPRQILDQQGHARQRPKIRPVTPHERTLQQSVGDLPALVLAQARFAARCAFAAQGTHPTLTPSVLPPSRRLATHPNTSSDFCRWITLFKHAGGTFAPPLHLFVISFLCRHAAF
jgi:hypothetical protein